MKASAAARILALGLVASLLLVACGGDDDADEGQPAAEETEEEEGGTVTIAGETAEDHGAASVAGATDAELELDDFYFEPTILTGEAGQTLTIALHNEGDQLHNFSLADQGIDQDVNPGEESEVEVTFPDSGELLFICKYHAGSDMRGGLQVEG